MEDALGFPLSLVIIFFSGIPHEVAHAYVAKRCGDDTAARMGRLSWNPVVHFDWVWTFIIPAIMLWTSGGNFCFGGPKPVPVVPWYMRNPARDSMLVSLAGPLTNLAICFAVAIIAFLPGGAGNWILQRVVLLNLILFCFNILPIPPLDGFGVLQYFLPRSWEPAMNQIRAGGIAILLLVTALGLHRPLMIPLMKLVASGIAWVNPRLFEAL